MIDEAAMLREFDVYRTGVRFDGTPVLSRDNEPATDATVVWTTDDPGNEMTVLDLEDLTDVSWLAEPEPWVPPKGMSEPEAAPKMPEPEPEAMVAAVEPDAEAPSEAEVHEMTEVVEDAERRVGELEAVIAQSMLASVQDHLFDDEPGAAIAASAAAAPVMVTHIGHLRPLMARLAALPAELPPDLATRVETLVDRLDALEKQIATMMLDQVEDMEMPAPSEDYVDETLAERD